MKRIGLIVALILLVVVLGVLNWGIHRVASPDEEDESAQSQTTNKSQAKAALPGEDAGSLETDLQPEQTVGDLSKAKYKITVGWVFDDTNQPNPQRLVQALQAVKRAAASSSAANIPVAVEIVDLDVPKQELSPAAQMVTGLGIAVNGQTSLTIEGRTVDLSGNPGEGMLAGPALSRLLPQVLR